MQSEAPIADMVAASPGRFSPLTPGTSPERGVPPIAGRTPPVSSKLRRAHSTKALWWSKPPSRPAGPRTAGFVDLRVRVSAPLTLTLTWDLGESGCATSRADRRQRGAGAVDAITPAYAAECRSVQAEGRQCSSSSRAIAARTTTMSSAFHAKAGRPFTARQRQSRPDLLPRSSTRSMQPPSAPSRAAGSCPGPARRPPPARRQHALCGRR
jgi:hypothetical protein